MGYYDIYYKWLYKYVNDDDDDDEDDNDDDDDDI